MVVQSLVLSKGARAFIITQNGCQGFVPLCHENTASWFYEFSLSKQFQEEMAICLTADEVNKLTEKLPQCGTTEKKEHLLKADHPTLYFEMLRSSGRTDDANKLYDGVPTAKNIYWYAQAEVLPKVSKLRKEGKLKQGTKAFEGGIGSCGWDYSGEVDEDGKACGIGELSELYSGDSTVLKGTFYNDGL